MKYINLEHHPNDSRVRIVDDDICQTLSQRMGTGGGNVPIVLEVNDADYTEEIFKHHYNGIRNIPND